MPTKCIIAYIVCVSSYKIGHKQATEEGFIIHGEIAGKKLEESSLLEKIQNLQNKDRKKNLHSY